MKMRKGSNNRVVVTGMGVVSPLGCDLGSMWAGLIDGKSGVDRISLFDPESFETKIAAEVKGFDPADYMDRKQAARADRFVQFAVAASLQAVRQAEIRIEPHNAAEVGVIIGSTVGGISTLLDQVNILVQRGPSRVSPFLAPMTMPDAASGQVSILLGAKGVNFSTTSSCASGANAIGESTEIIRRGDAQVMIAGGTEVAINPICIAAFNAIRATSTRNHEPQKASCPFDAERDGFVPGEGAGVLVLEDLHFALKRGAHILAEVIGYGATSDAYHMVHPDEKGGGGARAMQIALEKAKIAPEAVDYINAHGTSTQLNDKSETLAIKTALGSTAYHIPISSTKSMMGHLLSAGGAVEAVISILVIQQKVIPPTINLVHPDPDCDLDYVPEICRPANVSIVLSNSFGFGGHNSTLIFREYGV